MDFSYCNATDPNTNAPIDWQLRYAWLLENQRPKASVEHYIVKWSIENLSLLLVDEPKCIVSPYFCLDSSETAWCFKLFPNIIQEGQKLASFSVQRLDDRGPPSVDITYRFGVAKASCNRIVWFEQQKRTSFESGYTDGLNVKAFEIIHPVPDGTLVVEDTLKVICELYVSYPVYEYIDSLLTIPDYDLVNLSSDLIKLMRSKESCDYCIKIGNYDIIVHKAILGARSKIFNNILKDGRYNTRYELPAEYFSNMTNLLLFIYSGNFNLVSKNGPPDIGFYECAVEYSIPDLITFLSPNYLNIKSKLQREEIEFTWHVEDVSQRFASAFNCVRSPVFKCAYGNSPEWTLIMNARKVKGENLYNIEIYIESSVDIDVLHSVLKISLLDDKDQHRFSKTSTQSFNTNVKFGFPDFVKNFPFQSSNSCYVIRDTLKLHCRWMFVVSRDIFEEHVLSQRPNMATLASLSRLSQDLNRLFSTEEFSDISVKANNVILKAHKSILFSRSRTLASKFLDSDSSRNGTFEISDVDPAVVAMMINHAYSGILTAGSPETLVKLLSAADKYGFTSLSLICVQFLGPEINLGNFFELLNLGKRINNVNLVGKCLTFAKTNAEAILAGAGCQKWRREEQETYELLVKWIPVFAFK